jgi:hypothetical protein
LAAFRKLIRTGPFALDCIHVVDRGSNITLKVKISAPT